VIYADPSFLFSLYAWDGNSPTAAATMGRDQRRPLYFTPWQRFELRNAVRLAAGRVVRAGEPLLFQAANAFKAIQRDLAEGQLQHCEPDWQETMRLAEALSGSHTETLGTSSVDVWHIAAAVVLEAEVFWTFDALQHKLALQCGLIKRVPKLPSA
jgi:hypothetical protein